MSGLGELLLGKSSDRSPSPKRNRIIDGSSKNNNNDRDESGNSSICTKQENTLTLSSTDHHNIHKSQFKSNTTFPSRVEKNDKEEDELSNASSTDDYVRELLDPNDRPRNVWHVVEGPKKSLEDEKITEASALHPEEYSDYKNDSQQSPSNFEANMDISPDHRTVEQQQHHQKEDQELIYDARETEKVIKDESTRSGSRDRSSRRRHSSRDDRGERRNSRDKGRRSHRDSERETRRTSKGRSHHRRDYSDDEDERDRRKGSSRRGRRRSPRSRSRSRSPVSSSSRRRDRSRSNSPQTNSRTVILMQLSQRVDSRDIEDYFEKNVGRVREVKLIMDSRTRRHKGVAYVEFRDSKSASRALDLNGRKLHGVPMTIQAVNNSKGSVGDYQLSHSHHHHHHQSSLTRSNQQQTTTYPSSRSLPPNAYRVYIGALHTGITDEMLKTIVEPFGPVLRVEIIKDRTTGVSRGYAFITYANAEDGQEAVKNLDGFELAGKIMRVSKSTEKSNSEH